MRARPYRWFAAFRDGGGPLLQASRAQYPFIEHVCADSAYNHERVMTASGIAVQIVSKLPDQVGFIVLPRRWVVERFFAWIGRNAVSQRTWKPPSPRQEP